MLPFLFFTSASFEEVFNSLSLIRVTPPTSIVVNGVDPLEMGTDYGVTYL
jgi:hypothetical protein